MYSFFQKNNRIYRSYNPRIPSRRIYWHRKYNSTFLLQFSNFIISLWLFAFAMRIGSISYLALAGFGHLDLSYPYYSFDIPYSFSYERIENKRLHMNVSIESSGVYRFNGMLISKSMLPEYLRRNKIQLPSLVITIIADKDCKMELVMEVIKMIKKAQIKKVFFLTKNVQKRNDI